MEDPVFLTHYGKNPADISFEDLNFLSFSFKSYSSYPNFNTGHQNGTDQIRPAKQPKNSCSDSCTNTNPGNASSDLIYFHNSNTSPLNPSHYQDDGINSTIPVEQQMDPCRGLKLNPKDDDTVASQTCPPKPGKRLKRPAARSLLHAHEHVIAEKKRRENLSQQFITLAAVLPGLKKSNKSSVLEEAIKYVKHLHEQMKILEEQAANKKIVQSVRRTQYSSVDDEESSLDESSAGSCSDRRLPEIEAWFLDSEVLIRIHCEKKKGCLTNILREIETLDLVIVNSSVLPFGNSAIDITVISQMSVDFNMTVRDLVKNLKQALLRMA